MSTPDHSQLFRLDGKVALVTGASSGLGRHFAALLAAQGASVVLAARRRDALEAAAEDIRASGGTAAAVALDVTQESSVVEAVVAAEKALGPIDVLLNNSGVAVTKMALDMESEDWDYVMDTNLKGAFLVAREVARRMADRGEGGCIVNTASIIAFRLMGGLSAYAASKAALVQLTHALSMELARHRIRVNAIAPGYIRTEINESFFETPAGEAIIRRIPQRRLGEPSDLDGAMLLLASDASAYMTGSVLTVDGGFVWTSL
ncbi:MAG: SDR family NAD(P)-dependent oxidoreductase [Gammaproteobacteria bacterium]